jgi:hypothetical protein
MKKLYLHEVVVKKDIGFPEAYRKAQEVIRNKDKKFFRETEDSFRFRNIPKGHFDKTSFKSKVINENVTLIVGHLKYDEQNE